jgi:hypothetical protein
MRTKLTAVLLTSLLISLSAHAEKPQIQWDKQYDFSKVKTFKWQAPASPSLAEKDPFMHNFIQSAIETKLTEAGLTKTDGMPDVYVTYHGSTENEVQLQSDSFGYGIGAYGTGAWGMHGYGFAGPVSTTTRVVNYEKGTLVVDLWDPTQKQLVWRGTVDGILISDDKAKMQKELTKAIEAMAKQNRKLRAQAAT